MELPILDLPPEATAAWIYFHDEVERELRPGGDMTDTRDVSSKAADNAARLAALSHIRARARWRDRGGAYSGAWRIITWHLYEARCFLGELVLPRPVSNAAKLDAWLIGHCRPKQTTRVNAGYVLQFGRLRDKSSRDHAIAVLEEAGRVRLKGRKNQLTIESNPVLAEKS
jgi:hypothetical protein